MTNLLETIIKEVKELKTDTLIYVFVLTIISLFFDILYLRHNITHTFSLDIFRSIYIALGIFSNIFLFDRFCKNIRLKIYEYKKHKEEQSIYENRLNATFKLVEPIIDDMEDDEKNILKLFIQENSLQIAIKSNEMGYNPNVVNANKINAKLFTLGLNMYLSSNFSHLFLRIDKFYWDLLDMYFDFES